MSSEVEEIEKQVATCEGLARKLQEERRLRDELCSTVSHDMRSPVGAINIFCEILMSGTDCLGAEQKQSVKLIAEAAAKLQRIIEDTVEIARIHGDSIGMRWATVDARASVQSALHQVQAMVEQQGARIVEIFKAANPVVNADCDRLDQVMLRIVGDTLKSVPRGTEVVVSDENTDSGYILTVRAVADPERSSRVLKDAEKGVFGKGHLGLRAPGESRFGWVTCEKLIETFGGKLTRTCGNDIVSQIQLPSAPESSFVPAP